MNHKAGAGQWCSSDFHPKFRILYFSEIYQFEIDHFFDPSRTSILSNI